MQQQVLDHLTTPSHLSDSAAAVQPLPEVALYHTLQLITPTFIQPAVPDPIAQLSHHGVLLLQCAVKGFRQCEGEGWQGALLLLVAAGEPVCAG